MAGDPDIIARGQYRNDQSTPIGIGASTSGDGIANNVWLDGDVYSGTPSSTTSQNVEVKAVGTSFNGTATAVGTARALKVANLPTSRRGSSMIYDVKNKRFILFGGYDGTTRYNEAWELSADSAYHRWKKLAPTGTPPTAKNLAGAVYVRGTTSGAADKAYMVVWGGAIPADSSEMHTLDISVPGNEGWATITQTGTPAARSYITHHMVAKAAGSPSTSDVYLFGGWGATRTNDLQQCTFDVNTPTAVTWTVLKANGTAGNPPVRSGAGMIYDLANNRLVITSGYNGASFLSDVWQYSIGGGTFTQITPTGTAPGGRELPSIGYDGTNQRAVIIGGWQGSVVTDRNDIIQLSLTAGLEAWTQIRANDTTSQGILAYSGGSSAVDTSRNIMVVSTINGYDSTDKYVYAFNLNDTSVTAPLYSLAVTDYFRARDAPAFVYNSARSELLLINGYGSMDDDTTITRGEHVAETWAYNNTTNTWRSAAKGPFTLPQNEGGMAVYDSANDRIIYFGGLTGTSQKTNDVWQLKADSYGMYHATKLNPSGTKPTQRWLMAGCYDAANQRMVIWGGQGTAGVLGDVWALGLTSGSEAWTQLTPTGSAPTAAWQSSFAYDSTSSRLYIHGGATNTADSTFTSQLFYLNTSTTNCVWTNTGVTGGLAVRGASLGYDAANQRLVCFGGYNGSAVNNTVRYTSTSSFTSWTTQSTTGTPGARRSAGCGVIGSVFIVSCGRPVSGVWFSDTQELNFTAAPGAWAWTAKTPNVFQSMSLPVSGLVSRASYHWQTWATTGVTISALVPFGGNSESAADFVTSNGAGGNIKTHTGSSWVAKPVKVWNGSAWIAKPVKQWNGSAWIQTGY